MDAETNVALCIPNQNAMIEVRHLTKIYGLTKAVDDLSFFVNKGEILGFLGPNGAGKTTTMRVLTGYTPATSGQILMGGFDITTQSMQARSIVGYLPENAPLYQDMLVRPYLDFMAQIKQLALPSARKQAVDMVIEECGLAAVEKRIIRNLSKGYRQRVGLAQALLGDPQILVLDEPTVGLDPAQIAEIRNLIRSMAGKRTVILSTHILPEVSMTCSKVIIIHQGKIQAEGAPANLVSRFGANNEIQVTIEASAKDNEQIAKLLASIEGIDSVTLDRHIGDTIGIWKLNPQPGVDPRSKVAKAVTASQYQLLELHSTGISLEDVFLQVISGSREVA